MRKRNSITGVVAGLAIGATAAIFAVGQDGRQEWKLKASDTPGMAKFTVERWKPGNRTSGTMEVPWSRFHGLPADPFEHFGTKKFEYVSDAGRLNCKGEFSWSKGEGTYTFTPDSSFGAELKRLGYSAPERDQLFNMMMLDVSLDFARAVADAGLHATTRQLMDLRSRGVTLAYIRDVRMAGYENWSAQDYLDMRAHGVTTKYLQDLKAMGYDLHAREIIEWRNHGVTIEYVKELKDAGYDPSARQIVEMRNRGVNKEYLRNLQGYGLQPDATSLAQLMEHGVTPEYLSGLKEAGYGDLMPRQITELRAHGVTPEFMMQARSLGYHFTARELIDLRSHGVDGKYLERLRDAGMRNLRASEIEKLRMHGVD